MYCHTPRSICIVFILHAVTTKYNITCCIFRRNISLSTEPSLDESEEQDFVSLKSFQASQYGSSHREEEPELETSFDKRFVRQLLKNIVYTMLYHVIP